MVHPIWATSMEKLSILPLLLSRKSRDTTYSTSVVNSSSFYHGLLSLIIQYSLSYTTTIQFPHTKTKVFPYSVKTLT
jgi:hypothetical protein